MWGVGAYLTLFFVGALVFMLTVERDHFGSWRAVAADYAGLGAAILLFTGCALLLLRAGWLGRTPPHSRGEQGTRLVLAAACGASGGVITALVRGDTSRLADAAIDGAIWGLSLIFIAWTVARLLLGSSRVPPAP